jgi:hypothetical protein
MHACRKDTLPPRSSRLAKAERNASPKGIDWQFTVGRRSRETQHDSNAKTRQLTVYEPRLFKKVLPSYHSMCRLYLHVAPGI